MTDDAIVDFAADLADRLMDLLDERIPELGDLDGRAVVNLRLATAMTLLNCIVEDAVAFAVGEEPDYTGEGLSEQIASMTADLIEREVDRRVTAKAERN